MPALFQPKDYEFENTSFIWTFMQRIHRVLNTMKIGVGLQSRVTMSIDRSMAE
jgi:hypothetical protein